MTDPYNTYKPRDDRWKHVRVKKDRRQNPLIDIFRIDNHAPSSTYPYRARMDGQLLRNGAGEVRKFRTLSEATNATRHELAVRVKRHRNPLDLMTALNAAGDLAMMAEFAGEKRHGAFTAEPKRRKNPYGEGKCPPHLKRFRFKKIR